MNSKRRTIAEVAVGMAALAVMVGLMNELSFGSETVGVASFTLVMLAGNLALAIPAGDIIRRVNYADQRQRVITVTAVVLGALAVLALDFFLLSGNFEGDDASPAESAAGLATLAAWIAAFVIVWRPFIRQPENRLPAAIVTLLFASTTGVLVLGDALVLEYAGAAEAAAYFAKFLLASFSLAAAISAFLLQIDSHRALVDLNSATPERLVDGVPHLSRDQAEAVVASRGARPYRSAFDLIRVPGITLEDIERIRPHVRASRPRA